MIIQTVRILQHESASKDTLPVFVYGHSNLLPNNLARQCGFTRLIPIEAAIINGGGCTVPIEVACTNRGGSTKRGG